MKYYPAFLNLKGRTVLVVGAGLVAGQKIATLLECEAQVKIVAPKALLAIQLLAQDHTLTWHQRPYQTTDMEGVSLVIAATTNEALHQEIASEARRRGIWVNIVDVTPLCDFIAPSIVSRGDVQIAISTGGAAPALAKLLRKKLEPVLGPEYGELAELAKRYRPDILKLPQEQRRALWERVASDDFLNQIKVNGSLVAEQQLKGWIYGKAVI